MAEQIVTRANIRAKARAAYDRGDCRNSHGFNVGASALFDWLEEYDRCAAQVSQFAHTSQLRVALAQ